LICLSEPEQSGCPLTFWRRSASSGALLDAKQLTRLQSRALPLCGDQPAGLQLHVKPVVSLQIHMEGDTLVMQALDCELEGLGIVDDFALNLEARLTSTPADFRGMPICR
jgi:hypothetical protein